MCYDCAAGGFVFCVFVCVCVCVPALCGCEQRELNVERVCSRWLCGLCVCVCVCVCEQGELNDCWLRLILFSSRYVAIFLVCDINYNIKITTNLNTGTLPL